MDETQNETQNETQKETEKKAVNETVIKTVMVSLSSMERVQRFVATLQGLPGEFELSSERYLLDARSLMGIFGLDLSKPIHLKVYESSPETMRALEPFTVTEGEPSK